MDEEEDKKSDNCTHNRFKTIKCDHCKQKFCPGCVVIHRQKMKKEIDSMLKSCEIQLKQAEIKMVEDPVAKFESKLKIESQRMHARWLGIIDAVAAYNRQERFRILKEGARLATKRQKRYHSFIDEAKSINLEKLTSDTADKLIKALEKFIAKLEEPDGELEFIPNPEHDKLVEKFLAAKPFFYFDEK